MKEIWKDIPGWEGRYQASNLGRIKSLMYYGREGKEGLLKPATDKQGYLRVALCRNKKLHTYLVHRLVWIAFNGPVTEGLYINHINEDKQDARLENLNLLTRQENCTWGTVVERISKKLTNREDLSKPVIKLSKDNEILHFYPSIKQAERECGIHSSNIYKCINGKRNTAGGYKWKYA